VSQLALRSCIAAALGDVVENRGQRGVGMLTGHAGSTISRWGTDLNSWSAAALIDVAVIDAQLREVIIAAMGGELVAGSQAAAASDTGRAIGAMGDAVAKLAQSLHDGRITASEAKTGRAALRAVATAIKRLDADLAEITGGAK
jgi:hypothetical protein